MSKKAAQSLVSVWLVFSLVLSSVDGQQFDLNDLLGALGGASKRNEDGSCPSVCEKEANTFPVPKRRIRPYSNGCSVPESLRSQLGDYSDFEPCCDLHDACYMSCGIPKPKCEAHFKKCMEQRCQQKGSRQRNKCSEMANLFVMGTSIFGCNGYVELQAEGCECLPKKEAFSRVKDYAHEFYQSYNQTHSLPESFSQKYLANDDIVRKGAQGEMVYQLYRKYPDSIEVITRDGKSGRHSDSFFHPPPQREEL
jgi:hypothetical protein